MFHKAKTAENDYGRALRAIAREIGRIVSAFGNMDPTKLPPLRDALERYSKLIAPWAKSKAAAMLERVDKQNQRAWRQTTKGMALALREELKAAPIGKRVQELMDQQVKLITSLPLEAAQRVHKLVIENVEEQGRASEIAEEIARSGQVSASRATLIARTEVARTASVLTQARAEHIGSEGYVWRTARDTDVRDSHRKMEGKFVRWDSPPTLDGLTGHAGALPNCRCYPEPVIPE